MSKTPKYDGFDAHNSHCSDPHCALCEDFERIEAELAKANRYLNNVVTQCNVYIPLREAILKHLEKYR